MIKDYIKAYLKTNSVYFFEKEDERLGLIEASNAILTLQGIGLPLQEIGNISFAELLNFKFHQANLNLLELGGGEAREYGLEMFLDIKTGEIIQIDIDSGQSWFVNSDLESLYLFSILWNELKNPFSTFPPMKYLQSKGISDYFLGVKDMMKEYDAKALADDTYWDFLLEDESMHLPR